MTVIIPEPHDVSTPADEAAPTLTEQPALTIVPNVDDLTDRELMLHVLSRVESLHSKTSEIHKVMIYLGRMAQSLDKNPMAKLLGLKLGKGN